MSTWRSDAAAGAGPSAAITLDGGHQIACRPAAFTADTACCTRRGSGPKRAAYSAGETVRPEPRRAASWSWLRAMRPKLKKTVVVQSAGPRWAARRMAVARVGGGLGIGACAAG